MTEAAPKEPEAVSQPDALAELIERLGKLSGPDRELDARIHVLLGPSGFESEWRFDVFKKNIAVWTETDAINQVCKNYAIPPYTASIDVALTLVPEGAEWDATTIHGIARFTVGLNMDADGGPFYGEHKGGSVPLALCIAALRARQER